MEQLWPLTWSLCLILRTARQRTSKSRMAQVWKKERKSFKWWGLSLYGVAGWKLWCLSWARARGRATIEITETSIRRQENRHLALLYFKILTFWFRFSDIREMSQMSFPGGNWSPRDLIPHVHPVLWKLKLQLVTFHSYNPTFYFFIFFTEVQLIYIVLVLSVQQSDSVIHCTYSFSDSFPL